ncbi:MAG: HlyC/CorC family transporter [Candidatus Methanoliparum thermophilum]|uniref:HlyC/CorC family transporter n=1 Tax=Methanoliparum thermophilum TaxID=2491083 RepID=A0A520KTP7_METT2|nr:hemolysin family protein [Candidatus Methanoliparum sp. LAM-1]RZN65447.1 MAG: HlyC/CorC family transporter [Candidatus Methanoliparum thermophilum]BDC35464.1 membrane protein [Candidatus Methanoliparum sp. LAM-1]
MNISFEVVLFPILLFLSGFFSSSEVAILSISEARVRSLVDSKVSGSKSLKKLKDAEENTIITILIGNNLVNVAASAIATSIAIKIFGSKGIGIATGIVVLLLLIFGEVIPKFFATKNSERVALAVSRYLYVISLILAPFVYLLSLISHGIFKISNFEEESAISEEELKEWINIGREEGAIEGVEKEIMDNVFKFADFMAKDVMTKKEKIVSIDVNSPIENVLKCIIKSGHSRILLYEGDINNIVGVIHAKDLLPFLYAREDVILKDIMRKPYFVSEKRKVSKILTDLRGGTQIAIVLNSKREVVGVLTTEDILEEIVGEIEDEFDLSRDR